MNANERICLEQLRALRDQLDPSLKTHWLEQAIDVEFLRFIRASKSVNCAEAWKGILHHAKWRASRYGPDGAMTTSSSTGPEALAKTEFDFTDSPLHVEAFWLGLSKQGCPTLVVRTQVHDGIYYDEDPKIFTRY